jgi:sugar phosphate isomerase/epimerase
MNREQFIKSLGLVTIGSTLGSSILSACSGKSSNDKSGESNAVKKELFFKISLAEWSLHKTIFDGNLDHLDFPLKAKKDFDISAVEYVNQFFMDKAQDQLYLSQLKKRCDDNGVTSVLIMVDGEGNLGDVDEKRRNESVENHKKWVEAAKFLGCHSIRVNAHGEGTAEVVAQAATECLRALSTFAKNFDINVIVENHGGYSSNGQWLTSVIKATENSNCGTLPDFGNFCVRRKNNAQWGEPCVEWYDRYKGTEEMMSFAKGVSAKAHDFDARGNCVETDYTTIMSIVKAAGYTGHVGIEYEGEKLSEDEGIRATKALLERVGLSIS